MYDREGTLRNLRRKILVEQIQIDMIEVLRRLLEDAELIAFVASRGWRDVVHNQNAVRCDNRVTKLKAVTAGSEICGHRHRRPDRPCYGLCWCTTLLQLVRKSSSQLDHLHAWCDVLKTC